VGSIARARLGFKDRHSRRAASAYKCLKAPPMVLRGPTFPGDSQHTQGGNTGRSWPSIPMLTSRFPGASRCEGCAWVRLNPLGLNPLRNLLLEQVDFSNVNRCPDVRAS
jgi:hypothetical protein